MSKVKVIKKDAVINIGIGTGFLQQLQQLMLHIASNITPEELQEYQKLIQNKEPFTEDWMQHITTISILIREIEQKAEEQGFIYESDISEIIPEDNSPFPPTELQPE